MGCCFLTHKTGLYDRVKILDLSNFHHVNTSIKNASQVTVLVSPSSACFCLEVLCQPQKNCILNDFLLLKNESLKFPLEQKQFSSLKHSAFTHLFAQSYGEQVGKNVSTILPHC